MNVLLLQSLMHIFVCYRQTLSHFTKFIFQTSMDNILKISKLYEPHVISCLKLNGKVELAVDLGIWGLRFCSVVTSRPFSLFKHFSGPGLL